MVVIDHPEEVWVRFTYRATETPRRVCYYRKRGQTEVNEPPPALYSQYPVPIKKAKAADLEKLVGEFVPSEHHHFYADIIADENDTSDEEYI